LTKYLHIGMEVAMREQDTMPQVMKTSPGPALAAHSFTNVEKA